MAQNEMKAKPALPERVRSMEGLGISVLPLALKDLRSQYVHGKRQQDRAGSDFGQDCEVCAKRMEFDRGNGIVTETIEAKGGIGGDK